MPVAMEMAAVDDDDEKKLDSQKFPVEIFSPEFTVS